MCRVKDLAKRCRTDWVAALELIIEQWHYIAERYMEDNPYNIPRPTITVLKSEFSYKYGAWDYLCTDQQCAACAYARYESGTTGVDKCRSCPLFSMDDRCGIDSSTFQAVQNAKTPEAAMKIVNLAKKLLDDGGY